MCTWCEGLYFGNAAEDHLDTTTEKPHTTIPTLDDFMRSSPQLQGLRLQSVGQQSFENCIICGDFAPTLWTCKHCYKPTCRHPQCVSPWDSNVCANHHLCQCCSRQPSYRECLMCRVYFCPNCAAGDDETAEICTECEQLFDDPDDERYDEDGNYIPDMW